MLKFFSKYKIRSFYASQYRKMLILYSVFTIAVLLISSAFLINSYNKSLEQETEKSNKRLLAQIKLSSDIIIQENIMSIVWKDC